jgi:hypothetical protein
VDRSDPEFIFTSNMVSESLEKVRVADFIGTINVSYSEEAQGKARLFAELYRSGKKGIMIPVNTDLARMKFGVGVDETPDPNSAQALSNRLGYK